MYNPGIVIVMATGRTRGLVGPDRLQKVTTIAVHHAISDTHATKTFPEVHIVRIRGSETKSLHTNTPSFNRCLGHFISALYKSLYRLKHVRVALIVEITTELNFKRMSIFAY